MFVTVNCFVRILLSDQKCNVYSLFSNTFTMLTLSLGGKYAFLEDYLRNFQGCLIVVSHDRYFMDKMVDHLFVFEGEGVIKDIVGNYTDFRKKQIQDKRDEKNAISQVKIEKVVEEKTKLKEELKRKLNFKEKAEFESLEKNLEKLELDKATILAKISSEGVSNQDVYELGVKLGEIVSEIEEKTNRWIELSEFS